MSPLLAVGSLVAPAVEKLLDRLFPDPEQKAKALLDLKKEENQQILAELNIALQEELAQTSINQEEAKSSNLFVAGWRPFIGWICGVAFAYHFIIQPLLAFILSVAGHKVDLPVFDMDTLSTVLMGMLGLSGLRTLEKVKKTAK